MEFRRAEMELRGTPSKGVSDHADIVIIGNGIAGMTTALEARRLAPEISISIITDQSHPTINTPALKQFIAGILTPQQTLSYPAGTENEARVDIIHTRVEHIDTAHHKLHLSDSSWYGYGSLLIATGSQPMGISSTLPGHDLDGVITLHRLRDYLDVLRRLEIREQGKIREVVVIGGGVHASETVMGLLHRGLVVHWLIRGNGFYSKMLDQRASEITLGHYRRTGAQIWLNTEVVGIVGDIGSVAGVVTNKHAYLSCQLVIVCTGTKPAMELIKHSDTPIESGQGIIVDDQLQTSVPGIFAAGDIAAVRNPITNKYEPRAQWAAAVEQGQIVAAAMTGHYEQSKHTLGVFWHSTRLGKLSLLTVGTPLLAQGAESVISLNDGNYRRVTLCNKRLIGFLYLGPEPMDGVGIKRLIEEGKESEEMIEALLTDTFDPRLYSRQYHTTQLLTGSRNASQQQETHLLDAVEQEFKSVPQPTQPLRLGKLGRIAPPLYAPWPQITKEVDACIGCNECLLACPALAEPLTIDVLNKETLSGPRSEAVIRFARSCYQCGACVAPCPVGLHRDAMMMWLKVSLLRTEQKERNEENSDATQ